MKTLQGRFLAIAIGILVPLLTFEAVLRVWARVEGRRMAEEVVASDPLRRPIVVFCGDSHVYGVYVEGSETLASSVARLTQAGGAPGIRAVNLGVPGNASWDVLEQVKRAASVKPAAIVVACGSNNYSLMPADEGWGILEDLKLVKLLRRAIANSRVRSIYGKLDSLPLGPEGAAIPGGHFRTVSGTEVVMVSDREGMTQVQWRLGSGNPLDPAVVMPRMRADFLSMIAAAKRAGSKFIFSTYLAGEVPGFAPVTALMRELAASQDVGLADCALQLTPALTWNAPDAAGASPESRLSSLPAHARQNNQSAVLVKDLHPTPLGYEVEARVVARALATAGIIPSGNFDPVEPMRSTPIVKPTIVQSQEQPEEFFVESAPQDRIVVLLGKPGASEWNGTPIPLDRTNADAVRAKYGLREFDVTADADGKARIVIVSQCLRDLAPPVQCVVVAERGGRQGSARRFLSATLDVRIPPR